jgi:hypothetical protein
VEDTRAEVLLPEVDIKEGEALLVDTRVEVAVVELHHQVDNLEETSACLEDNYPKKIPLLQKGDFLQATLFSEYF